MNNFHLLPAAVLVALASAPAASAASFFSVESMALLTLTNPAALSDLLVDEINFDDFGSDATGNATAEADALADGFSVGALANGSALGMPFGAADGFGEASYAAIFENLTDRDITLSFTLDYELSSVVGADNDLTEDAFGFAGAAFSVDQIVLLNLLLDADLGDRVLNAADSIAFDVLIPAFSIAELELLVQVEGAATSVAPVPLPVAAPMLLAALGGLVALRRRGA